MSLNLARTRVVEVTCSNQVAPTALSFRLRGGACHVARERESCRQTGGTISTTCDMSKMKPTSFAFTLAVVGLAPQVAPRESASLRLVERVGLH